MNQWWFITNCTQRNEPWSEISSFDRLNGPDSFDISSRLRQLWPSQCISHANCIVLVTESTYKDKHTWWINLGKWREEKLTWVSRMRLWLTWSIAPNTLAEVDLPISRVKAARAIDMTEQYMGLLLDTQNYGLHMRREWRERFPTTAG